MLQVQGIPVWVGPRAVTVAQDEAADVVVMLEAEFVVVADTVVGASVEDATPTQYA